MISASDFYVFAKWADGPEHAFGGPNTAGVVPPEDKEAYWRIYEELLHGAESAIAGLTNSGSFFVREKAYSRERGSRGHRPTDLWVSICPTGSEVLGYFPQIYAIASERGLEVGFAASIAEADYFNAEVKERNRSIVPFINSKLPQASSELVASLDLLLAESGGWHFNRKTRLLPGTSGFDEFKSLAELIAFLKKDGEPTGGGVVCRILGASELGSISIHDAFAEALEFFGVLTSGAAPTAWDIAIRMQQEAVNKQTVAVVFDPHDHKDGRKRVIAEIAQRQGQAQFRRALLEAYGGRCAISRTDVPDVLQAAHIQPYLGPHTNHVTNGLLLRADLHTLFDLKLITIDPQSMKVRVSPRLRETNYWEFQGTTLLEPQKPAQLPDKTALEIHGAGKSALKAGA